MKKKKFLNYYALTWQSVPNQMEQHYSDQHRHAVFWESIKKKKKRYAPEVLYRGVGGVCRPCGVTKPYESQQIGRLWRGPVFCIFLTLPCTIKSPGGRQMRSASCPAAPSAGAGKELMPWYQSGKPQEEKK